MKVDSKEKGELMGVLDLVEAERQSTISVLEGGQAKEEGLQAVKRKLVEANEEQAELDGLIKTEEDLIVKVMGEIYQLKAEKERNVLDNREMLTVIAEKNNEIDNGPKDWIKLDEDLNRRMPIMYTERNNLEAAAAQCIEGKDDVDFIIEEYGAIQRAPCIPLKERIWEIEHHVETLQEDVAMNIRNTNTLNNREKCLPLLTYRPVREQVETVLNLVDIEESLKDSKLNHLDKIIGMTSEALDADVAHRISTEEQSKRVDAGKTGGSDESRGPVEVLPVISTTELVLKLTFELEKSTREMMQAQELLPPELVSDDEDEDVAPGWVQKDFFVGLGVGNEDAQPYFRANGTFKNNNIPKGICEREIKKFWKVKRAANKELVKATKKEGSMTPLHEAFFEWLVTEEDPKWLTGKKVSDTLMNKVAEKAFNIIDACLKYSLDADCLMFYEIITDELTEYMYHDEMDMIDLVTSSFQKADIAASKTDAAAGKVTGRLKKDNFLGVLRKCFPLKIDIRFNKIKRALSKEDAAQGANVHYVNLFRENADGDQGPFAEAIRDQHVEEREEYLEDIEEALMSKAFRADESNPDGPLMLTVPKITEAIKEFDPNKAMKTIGDYVMRGYGVKKMSSIKPGAQVEVTQFFELLSKGVVKYSTKRDAKDNSAM